MTYEMVMPFVVVASKGGPFDDSSYAAGWEAGAIDERLSTLTLVDKTLTLGITVHTENRPQLDLVAMKHGYQATFEDSEVEGWLYMRLRTGS